MSSSTMKSGLLNKEWEKTQIKVFTRWVAKQLLARQIKFEDVTQDFSDGVKLINLLEILGKESIGQRYHPAPKMRVQQLENNSIAINYITQKQKIKLVGISSDNIVDKNLLLTLGLTWTIINKFQIEDISVEEATARDALLLWSKKNTQGYEGVNVKNFTDSWNDGLAFSALINKFRPDVLEFQKKEPLENTKEAFEACNKLGLYVYLDPEDVVTPSPDEKSIVTQVAEYFHFFASGTKQQALAERLKKTIALQRELKALLSDYEAKARATLDEINNAKSILEKTDFDQTIPGIQTQLSQVIAYGRVNRPEIVEKRTAALTTWQSLINKTRANSRKDPVPPAGLEPEVLTQEFNAVEELAPTRRDALRLQLKEAKEATVKAYEAVAQGLIQQLQGFVSQGQAVSGIDQASIDQVDSLIQQINSADTSELQSKFNEIEQYQLVLQVTYTYDDVVEEQKHAASVLKRFYQNKVEQFAESQRLSKVEAFENKSKSFIEKASQIDKAIQNVSGSPEEKQVEYVNIQNQSREAINEIEAALGADFAELEKENLHLELEHNPASIQLIFSNLISSLDNLIKGIDAELAAQKGLIIPEEQLSEFRDAFSHFDKDHDGKLVFYELGASLTALGESSTDDECKSIIARYNPGEETLDFDSYVKFMLDRFSRAETARSTLDAFTALANGNPVITEDQLKQFFTPEEVEFLKSELPAVEGGYDAASWSSSLFSLN